MTYVPQGYVAAAPADKCPTHPGVKWYGTLPCFCCEPEAWVDAPGGYLPESANKTEAAGGVAATMHEMVASGHWPS